MAAPVKVARQQTTPELSGTFRTLPPQPTPTRAGTLRNPPEPSEPCFGTYTNTRRNSPERTLRSLPRPSGTNLSEPSGTYLLNLRQHTPEPSEILRNLPPEPTPFYTRTLRNLPEPACGTYTSTLDTPELSGTLQNLPEPSRTFRNLPPEPALATLTGTHRSLSGLKTSEDPISLRCWGKKEISFGGIPNSSSLMPYAMFDYMGAFLFRIGFGHADNVITKKCSKTITWLLLSRLQGNKPHSPEPSRTFRNLPPEPTPAHAGTLQNLPEPASGTYPSTRRNLPEPASGTCFRNLHQHTPEPSGTFRNLEPGTLRNLPEPASGTYTSTHRNPPEPSGTFLRNLLLRPAPAHTGAYLG